MATTKKRKAAHSLGDLVAQKTARRVGRSLDVILDDLAKGAAAALAAAGLPETLGPHTLEALTARAGLPKASIPREWRKTSGVLVTELARNQIETHAAEVLLQVHLCRDALRRRDASSAALATLDAASASHYVTFGEIWEPSLIRAAAFDDARNAGAAKGRHKRAKAFTGRKAPLIQQAKKLRDLNGWTAKRIGEELAPGDARGRSAKQIARIVGPALSLRRGRPRNTSGG